MASGGNEETTTWSLNLDVADALQSLSLVKDGLDGIGSADGLSQLAKKFTEIGVTLGVIGGAIFALKESMDLVFEGEQIDAINQQFEVLASNAGIAGDKLKEGLQEASAGLIDDTNLLKIANRGIVELGANAEHLDEVMTVARQASAVMGTDISASFEQITNAIASGQVRQLRSLGIIIDQKKAYDDYAKSIGVSTNELNKQGQQHAILNAVLEKSKTAFDGVNVDAKEATNAYAQLQATITDLKDIVIVAFEKTIGPTVTAVLRGISTAAKETKDILTSSLGTGSEQAAAKVKVLERNLKNLSEQQELVKRQFGGSINSASYQVISQQIDIVKRKLEEAKLANDKFNDDRLKKGISTENALTAQQEIDLEQRKKNEAAFNKQLDDLMQKNLQEQKKLSQSEVQTNAINDQQIIAEKKKLADEILKIENTKTLNIQQKQKLIEQTQLQSNLKLKQMEEDLKQERLHAWDEYAKHATSRVDGITRAFEAGAAKNKKNLADFGKLGAATFDSFSKNAASSFEAIGAGSQSAGDAMKGLLFSVLADMAEQQGTFMLLASIWPPNPVGLAGGAALLALAGFLRSQSGGSGGGGGGAVGSSVGANMSTSDTGFGTGAQTAAPASPGNLEAAPQKSVNLTIHGNYYDSNETKLALMDMIRQATDATDFNYFKVGGQ